MQAPQSVHQNSTNTQSNKSSEYFLPDLQCLTRAYLMSFEEKEAWDVHLSLFHKATEQKEPPMIKWYLPTHMTIAIVSKGKFTKMLNNPLYLQYIIGVATVVGLGRSVYQDKRLGKCLLPLILWGIVLLQCCQEWHQTHSRVCSIERQRRVGSVKRRNNTKYDPEIISFLIRILLLIVPWSVGTWFFTTPFSFLSVEESTMRVNNIFWSWAQMLLAFRADHLSGLLWLRARQRSQRVAATTTSYVARLFATRAPKMRSGEVRAGLLETQFWRGEQARRPWIFHGGKRAAAPV